MFIKLNGLAYLLKIIEQELVDGTEECVIKGHQSNCVRSHMVSEQCLDLPYPLSQTRLRTASSTGPTLASRSYRRFGINHRAF